MRPIDADALIDKYGDWYTEEGTEEGYIGTIKGIVDSMPTIEPEREGWVHIDDIYRLIAGHSDYHGDNILSALTCLAEGKKVSKPIMVLDTERTGELPSVQPERKTGKWIRNDNGTWSCDQCNSWIPDEQHYYARFCLYCGAKMEK